MRAFSSLSVHLLQSVTRNSGVQMEILKFLGSFESTNHALLFESPCSEISDALKNNGRWAALEQQMAAVAVATLHNSTIQHEFS